MSDDIQRPEHSASSESPRTAGERDPLTERTQWTNWTVLTAIVLALFVIFYFRPFGSPKPTSNPAVGKPLPTVDVRPLVGVQSSVTSADLTGHVVLINFWGPWCPPCRQELPHMARLYAQYREEGAFRFVPIAYPSSNSRAEAKALPANVSAVMGRLKIDMPSYYDPDFTTASAFKSIGAFGGFPTTVLVDRKGTIRAVWFGFSEGSGIEEAMSKWIGQLLAEEI